MNAQKQTDRQVEIHNIVFMQNDFDIDILCQDLGVEDIGDLDDETIVEYLMQWHYPGEHDVNLYSAKQIDTEFLGYRIDRTNDREGYLFSRNDGLGYVGLSWFEVV